MLRLQKRTAPSANENNRVPGVDQHGVSVQSPCSSGGRSYGATNIAYTH